MAEYPEDDDWLIAEADDGGWDDVEELHPPMRRRLVAAVVVVAFVAWIFAGTLAILFPQPVRELQRLGQRATFDPKAWREQPESRFGMAEDLERTARLSGLTRAQVDTLLGPPDAGASGAVLEYRLGSTIVPWPTDDVLLVSLVPSGAKVVGTRIGAPQAFTQRDWRLFPSFRTPMARDLVRRGALRGLDRAQVVALIGAPDPPTAGGESETATYVLGGSLVLTLRFGGDGRVSEQGVYTLQ